MNIQFYLKKKKKKDNNNNEIIYIYITTTTITIEMPTNFNEHYLLPLFISYRSSGEKLVKYQTNSFCLIMSLILMTTLFDKALILQGEI